MSFYRSVSCCALLTWLPGAFAAQVPEAALLRTVPWTDPLNPHAMVLDRDRLLVQQVDGLKVWELTANRITPAEGSPYPSERTELKRDAAPLGRDTLLTLAALDHPYGQPQPQALAVWSHDTQRLVAPLPLPEWRQVYRLLPLDDGHALVCGEPLPVAVGQPPRLRARVVQYAEGRLIWRQEPDAALSRLLAAARISGEVEGLGRSEAAASSPLRFDTAACRWQAGPLPGVPAEARDIIVTPVFYLDGTVLLDRVTWVAEYWRSLPQVLLWHAEKARWETVGAPRRSDQPNVQTRADHDGIVAGDGDRLLFLDLKTRQWRPSRQRLSAEWVSGSGSWLTVLPLPGQRALVLNQSYSSRGERYRHAGKTALVQAVAPRRRR